MERPPHWDLFLSHSTADKELALRIQADVEGATVDGRELIVWLDDSDVPFGGNITKFINEGLEQTQRVALLMTPAYFSSSSGWTDAEWHAALFADPDNREQHVIPILAEDCAVPALLRPLKRVDMRGRYAGGIRDLLTALSRKRDRRLRAARAVVPSAEPDAVPEMLHSNLFRFTQMPQAYYTAELRAPMGQRAPSEWQIVSSIREESDAASPPFQVYGNQIRSFSDLSNGKSVFAEYIDRTSVRRHRLDDGSLLEWARAQVTGLINACIARHLERANIVRDDLQSSRFFFPASITGESRDVRWTPAKRSSTRIVAKPLFHTETKALLFWRHSAAYVNGIQLGDDYALEIRPTYVLTSDGFRVKSGPRVGRLVQKWTGMERNFQIFYNVLFWRFALDSAGEAIETGGRTLCVSPEPLGFRVNQGIAADHRDYKNASDISANDLETDLENLDLEPSQNLLTETVDDE